MPTNINPMPDPAIVEKLEEVNGYRWKRRGQYAALEDQLDMLFRDIDAGLFGEPAKTGEFYSHINAVKESLPAPENLEVLKIELDTLIAQDGE